MAKEPDSTRKTPQNIERIVKVHGDLLFDLCESILWSTINAQAAFARIVKDIRHALRSGERYTEYERAWILRLACERLRAIALNHGKKLSPSEQIMLDAILGSTARLKQFDSYFHRLTTDDQILLLLKDKYGLPYPEIATAMGIPEGSLKMRRQQALRILEDWLWD